MVVDAVLWVLLAAAIALIAVGCHTTKPRPKEVEQTGQDAMDRAA